jgi:hypothetical protein
MALAAVVVREKNKTAFVHTLEQYRAGGRPAGLVHRRQHHRVHVNRRMAEDGVPEFVERNADFPPAAARRRLREPLIELRQRIRVQIRASRPPCSYSRRMSAMPYGAEFTTPADFQRLNFGRQIPAPEACWSSSFSHIFLIKPRMDTDGQDGKKDFNRANESANWRGLPGSLKERLPCPYPCSSVSIRG